MTVFRETLVMGNEVEFCEKSLGDHLRRPLVAGLEGSSRGAIVVIVELLATQGRPTRFRSTHGDPKQFLFQLSAVVAP